MTFQVGARLGAYEIVSALGAGGMGEVYRAHDSRLGRDVALKILPDAMAKDPDGLSRFEREARAVAALNHPHIVTIYTTEEAEGTRFMTMELVEGRTLDQLVPSGGLPLPQFFDIATALADALQAAHQKHITHRDLKPSNVMVAGDGRVKVLDFGLASAAGQPRADAGADDTKPALTRVGTILGTIPYMSPEQLEGKPIDHRSDLFSLGVVLYEIVSGQRPFGGDSSAAMMSSTLRDQPRPLSEVRPGTPDGVSRLVTRCLEKHTRDRVQTAHEVLIELRALQRAWESGTSTAAQRAEPRPDPGRLTSIAVLPFTDMSAAKDQDWFCDGIAEEILNALTSLKGLRVAARTSAFSFRGKSDDLRAIGEKLNVTTVLEGSVRRVGDRVRITAQLSSVQDGFQLWSERYDREIKDIFDVQDEIAKAIAERLRITISSETDARLVPQATHDIEAYQVYLRGRALLYRRGPGVALALEQFQKAVALDPNYAQAWAGIADVYSVHGMYGTARPAVVRARAIEAASRAVALDPTSAEAHAARAMVMLGWEDNAANAEREFARSLELNPHYVQGRCWYAIFYLQWGCGRFEEGLAEARHAMESDPLSAYAMGILTLCLGTVGLADEALAMGRRAIEADPESFYPHWTLGLAIEMAGGDAEVAVTALQKACRLSPQASIASIFLATAHARAGHQQEARVVHQTLAARAASEYVPSAYLSVSAAAVGDHEQALVLAQHAWEEREPFWLLCARHATPFRWHREQPELAAMFREMDASGEGGQ